MPSRRASARRARSCCAATRAASGAGAAGGQGNPAGSSRRRRATRCGRSRIPTSTSARMPSRRRIARIENERTQTYVARERRLELSDGDIDAKVALRIAGLDVTTPGSDRKLIGHRPARHRRRRPHRPVGRQRRRQVDAPVGARRRLRSGARALRQPGGGALQSVLPAGLFRPVHARPAARHGRSSTTSPTAEALEREGRHPLSRARPASPSPTHRRADRRAEPRRAGAAGVSAR